MRWVTIHALVAALATWALIASGCAKDPASGTKTAKEGTERGACYGNGTCNEGLICLSDLCVRPPPADCTKVAKKVGYLTLSNYAAREERAAFETQTLTECKNLHLTKEEGDCILRAENRTALRACPKPMGLGRCDRVAAHLAKLAPADKELARFLERGSEELIRQCEKRGITAEDEKCILAATNFQDMSKCDPGRR